MPAPQKSQVPRRNPLFPVGVNYYPSNAETDSWDQWYTGDVNSDFAAIAAARFSMVRVFVSWKVLEPQVGQYNEEALERFAGVLAAAREHRLQVIVCFFADDRHSELLDVLWGKRRDPRTDPYLISRQVALVQKVVNRFRGEEAVFAWDLANEAFLSGFTSAEDLEAWAAQLREAIREVDPTRRITLSADVETLYRQTGVDSRRALDECEFAVSHVTSAYRAYAAQGPIDRGPGSYLDSFLLRLAARDLPVLMDDVGVFSLDNSPAEEAAQVRTALYSGLMNRAAGVMLRRYKDLDTERREPYFRDPFEVLVGIADTEGRPKVSLAEAESFIKVAARIDLRRYSLVQERTAVIVPSERYEPLPNLAGLYDPRACLQAYIGVKQAHVPVTIAREDDRFEAYSVLVIPSAFRLSDATWDRVISYVQRGGSLVMSYGGGDAHTAVRDVFGVEFLGDGGERDTLSCRVAQADMFGALRSFDVKMDVPNFALLGNAGATVVATDAKGSPLLTRNQFGQGLAIYIAAPIERALAQGDPWAPPEAVCAMLREVYGAVARKAGCGIPLTCDRPQIEIALFVGEHEDIVLLLNHEPRQTTATLTFERPITAIADVRGGGKVDVGATSFGIPVAGNAAVALKLSYS